MMARPGAAPSAGAWSRRSRSARRRAGLGGAPAGAIAWGPRVAPVRRAGGVGERGAGIDQMWGGNAQLVEVEAEQLSPEGRDALRGVRVPQVRAAVGARVVAREVAEPTHRADHVPTSYSTVHVSPELSS